MATPLFTRWFQAHVFSPGFRVPPNAGGEAAPWHGPAPSQKALVDCIRLRRRLALYATSTETEHASAKREGSTRVPPATLGDYARASEHLHAFGFGPSLLVQPAPPTGPGHLRIDLPPETGWIDFWTGAFYPGAQSPRSPAPLEIIPLFVRAGSIVPMASVETPGDGVDAPLEIRVYPGEDGALLLRDGTETIAFAWNDRENRLRVGTPAGAKTRRPFRRHLEVVVVRPGRGVGLPRPARPDVKACFEGVELILALPPPPARPHAPMGFNATPEGDKIVFTWEAPCAGALYRVKRVVGPSLHEDLASALASTRHVLSLGDFAPPFECVVTAMNAGGESAPSASVKVAPPSPCVAGRFKLAGGPPQAGTPAATIARRDASSLVDLTSGRGEPRSRSAPSTATALPSLATDRARLGRAALSTRNPDPRIVGSPPSGVRASGFAAAK